MPRREFGEIWSEVDAFFRQDNDKKLVKSKNGDAVADSIRNIIKTVPGERVMNRDFGCDILKALFEPMTEETALLIGEDILESIEEEDPRVSIERVIVSPDYDSQTYNVTIDYFIKKLPGRMNRVELQLSGLYG